MIGSCFGAPIILDFRKSHTVQDFKDSGLQIQEIRGGLEGQAYVFQNQEVEVLLPVNRLIRQSVVLGTVDTREGVLTEFDIYGDVMPHDQAAAVGRSFLESFGLPTDKFESWIVDNQKGGRDGKVFSVSANLVYYPRVSFAVRPSMNGLYPWVTKLLLSWNWDKQRDWNEERAWKELPLPAPGYEAVSLNPPSGLKYDRKEAYKEIIAESEALQKKVKSDPLVASGTSAAVIEPSDKAIPEVPPAPPTVQEKGISWWTIGGGVALVVAAAAWLIRRSKPPRK